MSVWDDIVTSEDKIAYAKYQTIAEIGWGRSPAVLVVDLTYAFVDDRFSTGWSKTGRPCVENTVVLLAVARERGVPVIYIKGAKRPNKAQLGNWKSGGILHDETEGDILPVPTDIVAELSPLSGDPVIEKSRPSAFFGTILPGVLNHYRPDTLIITGMSTSGCIRATVVDAFSYNYRVIVPGQCVADRSPTAHKANLWDIQMKYGDVVDLEDVKTYLSREDIING